MSQTTDTCLSCEAWLLFFLAFPWQMPRWGEPHMLDSHSRKQEMSPVKPRKSFSRGSNTSIISCHADQAWALPSTHGGPPQSRRCGRSPVSLLCAPLGEPPAPGSLGTTRNKPSTSFFFLSFYTLYLTSHYLFQTWFSVLVTVGPKEGWGNGLEWTGWL